MRKIFYHFECLNKMNEMFLYIYRKYFVFSGKIHGRKKNRISLTSLYFHLENKRIHYSNDENQNGFIVIGFNVILMCIYNIDIVLVFKMPTIHDGLYFFLSLFNTLSLSNLLLFSLRSRTLD